MPNISAAIYGEDNRKDVYEVSGFQAKEVASSVAALIFKESNFFSLYTPTDQIKVEDNKIKYRMCSSEKFSSQYNLARCTAVLVAPDVVLTAYHCVKELVDSSEEDKKSAHEKACKKISFLFDYVHYKSQNALGHHNDFAPIQSEGKIERYEVKTKNLYACEEVLKYSKAHDIVFLKLNKKVKGRRPLPIRNPTKEGEFIPGKSKVAFLGYSLGLPLKVDENPKFWFHEENSSLKRAVYQTDTSSGSSGGILWGVESKRVEGILVAGHSSFPNRQVIQSLSGPNSCLKIKRCQEGAPTCSGEYFVLSKFLQL